MKIDINNTVCRENTYSKIIVCSARNYFQTSLCADIFHSILTFGYQYLDIAIVGVIHASKSHGQQTLIAENGVPYLSV